MNKRIDRFGLGRYIQKVRKKRGLRQIDLVDDVLSQTTISYIEAGTGQVSEKKIQHLLDRLGIQRNEVERFFILDSGEEDENLEEEWELRLTSAENIIDLVGPEEGNLALRSVSLPSHHPFEVWFEYLKGKIDFQKKNWVKAENHFFQAIHLISQYPDQQSNLESACFHELGRIAYMQNRYQNAIDFAEKAQEAFQPEGERSYYLDFILISKVIYLEKLNLIGEAQKVLDELASRPKFEEKPCFFRFYSEAKEAMLNMYEMQSKLLQRTKRNPQALEMALKGIELARIDKNADRAFELWTTLGSIYMETDKAYLAEICYRTALKLRDQIKRTYLLAYVYSQLGSLYYKLEEYEKSNREFREALKYAKKTNEIFWQIEALTGLGKCAMANAQYQTALEHLHQALSLAKEHNLEQTALLLLIGQCLMQLGDPKLDKIALDLFYSQLESSKGGDLGMRGRFKRHAAGDPPGG